MLFLLYTAGLVAGSLGSPPDVGLEIPHLDKAEHFLAYGVYSLILLWVCSGHGLRTRELRILLPAFLYVVLFGTAMELAQWGFRPGVRSFEWADIASNTAGALIVMTGRIVRA